MLSSLKGLYISPLLARGAERSKLLNIHRERARYWLDSLGTKEKPDINEITFWAEEWISALDLNLKVRAMDYISSKKLHWIYKHNFPVNSYLCYFLERELEQRKLFS